MKEQKACYNCRHRVPNASAADKCNIDGRRIEFAKCFTAWCPYWAMDELRRKEETMNKKGDIMHCKDCMWYDTESEWSIRGKHMCIFHDIYCSPDDFCSWAERDEEGKEEEND